MPHTEPVTEANTWSTIIAMGDSLQIHVYGEHNWVSEFLVSLEALGVQLTEVFRSPCG